MFKFIPILAIFSISYISCTKETIAVREGVYKGTFRRLNHSNIDFGIAQVTLHLDEGKFNGTSSMNKYPAIGSGNYSTVNQQIDFENTSAFTADFDWTLILNETFEMKTVGDSLILTKGLNGVVFYKDEYRLKRQ